MIFTLPYWIWFVFVFAMGCCIGSFLNVVIYRLPRDRSLVKPGSACPACGKAIRFYDNIPLVSWIVLAGKCRHCKAGISPRYFVIEFLTGSGFAGFFYLYFCSNIRSGINLTEGGWFIYLMSVILLSALIAASAIDLELWIIPLCICWFLTIAGLIGSSVGVYIIDPQAIRGYNLLPSASVKTGAIAFGAMVGLIISFVLLSAGVIKRSYEAEKEAESFGYSGVSEDDKQFNHRLEIFKEIVFLLPVIACAFGFCYFVHTNTAMGQWWLNFSQKPVIAGFLGSMWGYFVGCGVVWATRIFGTLVFNKEAMGLGDVHLMGAAGTIIGWKLVFIAFFVAPFFGLAWALFQMFFRKTRQIPYGPFLSSGIIIVMIFHDRIFNYLNKVFYR